jgi:predicted transcriptional regulator
LILYSETREGAQKMLNALADFCNYSNMAVNIKKCVSVSVTWQNGQRVDEYQPFTMRMGRCAMD